MAELTPELILIGTLLITALVIRLVCDKVSMPAVVVYLALGSLLALLNNHLPLVSEDGSVILNFMSSLGIVALLFKVGIESDLHELLKELPKAAAIWLPNMLVSGIPGYLLARYGLDYAIVPSLFVGVALTATSVGVSVAVWEETGRINSKDGNLLLDTAELDDISGVVLMALLFSIAPILHEANQSDQGILQALIVQSGEFFLTFAIFLGMILWLGRRMEGRFEKATEAIESKALVVVLVMAVGIIIAATAGAIGLSIPIGALLAGLLLSRHRDQYGVKPFYESLYALFVPFFFIKVGYQINPEHITGAAGMGLLLLFVAVAGKIFGTTPLARMFTSLWGAVLIGVSMVPRAEITMVVIERGKSLGSWAMPEELYAAMVFVSAGTCLFASFFLHWALRK